MSLVLVLNSFRGLLRSFLRVDLSTTPILALGGKGDKCISDHLFGLWYHSHMKGEEIIAVIIMSLWFYV